MIRKLRLKNFKAWKDTGDIRMAPLTLFCGTNSSGKSALLHFLISIKMTLESEDNRKLLNLGDEHSIMDVGDIYDVIHNRDITNNIEFSIDYELYRSLTKNTFIKKFGQQKRIRFNASLGFDREKKRNVLNYKEYRTGENDEKIVKIERKGDKYEFIQNNLDFKKIKNKTNKTKEPRTLFKWPKEVFWNYEDFSEAIVPVLQDTHTKFQDTYYLGPLRDKPGRIYQLSGERPAEIGSMGTYSLSAIMASKNSKISRGYRKKKEGFEELVARWLKQMGLIHSFSLTPISQGRREHEVLIRIQRDSPEVQLPDVGFGISQILPVIVHSFYHRQSQLIYEQPEIHLHPSVQSELGDLFLEAINARDSLGEKNNQLIVETHSEHLIRRVQRRIAENKINPDDVAIYFVNQKNGKSKIEELNIDEYGYISNWPENFFGDSSKDLVKMTEAMMNRKLSNSK